MNSSQEFSSTFSREYFQVVDCADGSDEAMCDTAGPGPTTAATTGR